MNRLLAVLFLAATGCAELEELRQYKEEQLAKEAAYNAEHAKWKAEQDEKDAKAYMEWYNKLSYQEKMHETRWQDEQRKAAQAREDALLLNYLAIVNGNMNAALDRLQPSLQYRPAPPVRQYDTTVPTYTPQLPAQNPLGTNCISRTSPYGGPVYTHCY